MPHTPALQNYAHGALHNANSPLLNPQDGSAIHAQRVSHFVHKQSMATCLPRERTARRISPPNKLVPWNYTASSSRFPHTKTPLPTHTGWLGPGCVSVRAGPCVRLGVLASLNRAWPICFNFLKCSAEERVPSQRNPASISRALPQPHTHALTTGLLHPYTHGL